MPQFPTSSVKNVEGRLVELDDVDAQGLKLAGFGIEQLRERHRHIGALAIMAIGDGVANRHRAGQREFQLAGGVGAHEARAIGVNRAAARERGCDGRHLGDIAVVADAHLGFLRPVDAVDVFEKAMDEMDPELFAVGHDLEPGVFLQLQPHQCGIALRRFQLGAGVAPGRPQLFRFSEPGRFWQAAGNRGGKHRQLRHQGKLHDQKIGPLRRLQRGPSRQNATRLSADRQSASWSLPSRCRLPGPAKSFRQASFS